MKIATTLTAAATLLAPTLAFTSPKQAFSNPLTLSKAFTLPQENGAWAPHSSHPDTRHTILPQELGVWSTSPPAGYVPPPTPHIGTRKKILEQESKGVWPTSPPPGWVCPKPEGCCAEDIREAWESYAPYSHDGRVGALGFVGCPGGGDWCYASSGAATTRSGGAPPSVSSKAQSVAAALAGLGSGMPQRSRDNSGAKKSYGIGSWKNTGTFNEVSSADSFDSLGESSWAINSNSQAPTSIKPRRPIVAGNWKLNPSTRAEAITLLKLLSANFLNNRNTNQSADTPETVIFPPLPYLSDAVEILEGTGIQVGAQDVGPNEKGAFTGEVAPGMLVSAGCSYVLLGHSERRTLFGETDDEINAKLHTSLEQPSLKVILCVGETLQEYENGLLESVVDSQIRKGLDGVDPAVLMNDRVIIAYEPVWAIGTGLVATPAQAQHAHVAIRNSLANMYDTGVAGSVRIQYGGSVTADSTEELMGENDVDGALVGGASLNADSFTRIYDGATTANARKKGNSFSDNHFQPLELTASLALATTNALGESPVWSDRDQCLYWVSATEGEVWRWDLHSQPHRRLINSAVGCVGLLQSSAPGSLIIAAESAILTTTMITPGGDPNSPIPDFASGPSFLCDRPEHMSTTRPNDGRVDRFGNFVVGMYNQYHRAGATAGENNAGLFRLNSQSLQWEEILDYRFRVSNCICFSPDGRTMYFGDTPTRTVYAFDYSPNGPLTNRRMVWTMPSNMPGGPDGAQVDANGKLWVAVTGAGRVVQLNPSTGNIEMTVHVDANPTSLTFGGQNLDELFITTRAPNGGGLYRVKMPYGIRGVPEPEFLLNVSRQ